MPWSVEVGQAARDDLRRIYRHLIASNGAFGHDLQDAKALSRARVFAIEAGFARLAKAPYRGTCHTIAGHTYRHVTIDRAVYWFTLDEPAEVLRIEAIFFGGQDHLDRMFNRLREEGEAP